MLRYYQTKSLQQIKDNFKAGKSKQLLCACTGSGKTITFAYLPSYTQDILPNGQTMILVHRDELAKQAMDKMRKINPTFKVQQEAGTEYSDPTSADVIVASVQTLGRKNTERVKKFNWPNIKRLVVDEAHRSIADSYYNVYNAGGYLENNGRLLLGCTATPTRGDGQGLSSLYQCIPYTYSLQQAIEDGYLVDVKGIRVNTTVSLDGVKTSHGDFNETELAEQIDNPYRNSLVVSAYIKHCSGRQAIGFGANIEHSRNLAATFRGRGIVAEAVWGADPKREDKINRFRKGEIQVLFCAQLLVEGFDHDMVECVILASPTKSGVVFSQRVGRGTRLQNGISEKYDNLHNVPATSDCKRDCIVLDVVDSTYRHNLITLPTLIGLPSGMNLNGRSLIGSKKIVDEMLEKHPHLDFTTLTDIDKIEAFVENVNLFQIKFPEEVEQNSEFTWHAAYSGGYVLMLPDKDEVRIRQNLLDKYELSATIKGKTYKGERNSIDTAFAAADDLIRKTVPEVLQVVKREASWHKQPPTPAQMKLLKKLYKGKQISTTLTKGEASNLIGAALAGKGKQ